jgi:hypothetical protein
MAAKAFDNQIQKASGKWPFKNWTLQISDVDCIVISNVMKRQKIICQKLKLRFTLKPIPDPSFRDDLEKKCLLCKRQCANNFILNNFTF